MNTGQDEDRQSAGVEDVHHRPRTPSPTRLIHHDRPGHSHPQTLPPPSSPVKNTHESLFGCFHRPRVMVLIIITYLIKYFEQFADDDGLAGLDVSEHGTTAYGDFILKK